MGDRTLFFRQTRIFCWRLDWQTARAFGSLEIYRKNAGACLSTVVHLLVWQKKKKEASCRNQLISTKGLLQILLEYHAHQTNSCQMCFYLKFKFLVGPRPLQVSGRVRVLIKPILTKVPLFGAISVCLLEQPVSSHGNTLLH